MEHEQFYAVTLDEKNPLSQFEVSEACEGNVDHKLVIKQVCLGADANNGEYNVVQVETQGYEKGVLKIPIAVLKAGETRVLRPNIEFACASVTFKLIQGAGPVYLSGQHLINMFEEEEDDWHDDEGGDEDYDEEINHIHTNGNNKKK